MVLRIARVVLFCFDCRGLGWVALNAMTCKTAKCWPAGLRISQQLWTGYKAASNSVRWLRRFDRGAVSVEDFRLVPLPQAISQ
jgi:hypothetical protein